MIRFERFYYSDNLLFEKANLVKNQLISLKNLKNKSIIISNKNINIDCFFIISFNNYSYINFTRVTEGSIVYFKNFKLKNKFFWDEVFVLKNFINNTFVNYGFLHKEIITNISNVCFLGGPGLLLRTACEKVRFTKPTEYLPTGFDMFV